MKTIYEIKYMDSEHKNSKSIVAYANQETALYKMKKLNAQYGKEKGNPFFVNKKIIE